jgi:hypothetical protein
MPRAPSTKKERNYILRIELQEVENPKVIRTLSVPPSTTFHKFHYALCLAFGWLNCHTYDFAVYTKYPFNLPDSPRVGRTPSPAKELLRIDCPSSGDGFDFSDLLKGGPGSKPAKTTPVSEVFGIAKYRNKYISYLYDFGENWEHSITLIGRAEEDLPPNVITLVSGEGGGVSEDWGASGWEELKRLVKLRDEKGEKEMNEKDREYLEMYEDKHGSLDKDDVYDCKTDHINERLTDIDDDMRSDEKDHRWGIDSDFEESDSD